MNIPFIEDLCKLKVTYYDITDSTNNRAKDFLAKDPAYTGLIIADSQTAGRGRSGKSFYSPAGNGIYMTFTYKPNTGIGEALSITTRTAVCVASVLEEVCNDSFQIKWVNDIYYHDKKVCGILAEAITTGVNEGSVIVGIGINVSPQVFPSDIADIAGSLPLAKISREEIIGKISKRLVDITSAFDASDITYLDYYRSHSYLTGRKITYIEQGISKEALVLGIDDDGGLIVQTSDESSIVLHYGEVNTIRATGSEAR